MGGEKFQKLQSDPPLQLSTKEYIASHFIAILASCYKQNLMTLWYTECIYEIELKITAVLGCNPRGSWGAAPPS